MKNIADLNLPDDRRYSGEHVWIKKDGDGWIAGISDYAQDQLGEVVYVDLDAASGHLDAGQSFGNVESVKSVNELYMPVSGNITARNEIMADEPSRVNVNCYADGWLVRIQPDNPQDVEKLMDAAAYRKNLETR